MNNRKYTPARMARAFKIYRDMEMSRRYFIKNRWRGSFGIVVEKDKWALMYQKNSLRHEIISSWLSNRPINWFMAYYLPHSEARKRNE